MSPTPRKIVVGGAFAAVLAGGGGGIAAAAADPRTTDDDEIALTGTDLERASRAALEASRAFGAGGTVTGTESPGEEPYSEVDVTLSDGTRIDFDLDSTFAVVGPPEVEGHDLGGHHVGGHDDGGDDDGGAD